MSDLPDPFDVALGARIRKRREALKVTQAQLAAAAEVTFQQIQKYERGVNRVSAARLALIAAFLQAHPADFYGYADQAADAGDPLSQLRRTHDGLELADSFVKMSEDHRRSLISIVRAMTGPSAGDLARMAAA
ncbi:transcriptional regulator [Brevundimonas intermedia]|uniref:Transcriptional regulator n=1 Tax=Brevundimonas intermedia TaxID=74315 RepID=A0ABQ5TA15_9CAUL|nr:helix-turn-helix transcriptional regulator [Brevundimonas intermedia]GLK49654.1 transcriptional regulator [Brevundimonas intermedia]